jgi:hypothetical protein
MSKSLLLAFVNFDTFRKYLATDDIKAEKEYLKNNTFYHTKDCIYTTTPRISQNE